MPTFLYHLIAIETDRNTSVPPGASKMTITVLDPKIRHMLDKAAAMPPWNAVPMDRARDMFLSASKASAGDTPKLGRIEERLILGPDGPIAARLYVPDTHEAPRPTLLYFHGGGFVLGSLDSHDALCRHICASANVQVLSADYRLSPAHKFPAALDDALAVARWLVRNHATIDADLGRLAIGGDSAGANLATTVCRELHARGQSPFRHQTLIYPMVDLRLGHPSIEMFGEGYRLTRDILRWFTDSYVRAADQVTDPRVSPLLANDLRGLPPAFVLTAGFDPLRDEGRAYAQALTHAGVACDHTCFEDMIHGFCNMPAFIPRAHDAFALVSEKLCAALA